MHSKSSFDTVLEDLTTHDATLHSLNSLFINNEPHSQNPETVPNYLGLSGRVGGYESYIADAYVSSLGQIRTMNEGVAYLAGPDGTFTIVTPDTLAIESNVVYKQVCGLDGCSTIIYNINPVTDYVNLTLAQGGSVWSLDAVRNTENPDLAVSLGNAFAFAGRADCGSSQHRLDLG